MATTSRLAAVKSALVDLWAQRSGLTGVQIASAELGGSAAALERIELIGDDTIEQDWVHVGRLSRDERLTLVGSIYVMKPGAGETVIRAARDRAFALMAEIELSFTESQAASSIGGLVKAARARPFSGNDIATPDGRVYLLGFEIVTELTRLTYE